MSGLEFEMTAAQARLLSATSACYSDAVKRKYGISNLQWQGGRTALYRQTGDGKESPEKAAAAKNGCPTEQPSSNQKNRLLTRAALYLNVHTPKSLQAANKMIDGSTEQQSSRTAAKTPARDGGDRRNRLSHQNRRGVQRNQDSSTACPK
jgi:hypothetical protein